jgi:hypothetical protein
MIPLSGMKSPTADDVDTVSFFLVYPARLMGTLMPWVRVVGFSALGAVFFAAATGPFGPAARRPRHKYESTVGKAALGQRYFVIRRSWVGVAAEFRAKVLYPPLLVVELIALFGGAITAGLSPRRLAK